MSKATAVFAAMLLAALTATILVAYIVPFTFFGAYSVGEFDPFGYVGGITDTEMLATLAIAAATMYGLCYGGTVLVEAKIKS